MCRKLKSHFGVRTYGRDFLSNIQRQYQYFFNFLLAMSRFTGLYRCRSTEKGFRLQRFSMRVSQYDIFFRLVKGRAKNREFVNSATLFIMSTKGVGTIVTSMALLVQYFYDIEEFMSCPQTTIHQNLIVHIPRPYSAVALNSSVQRMFIRGEHSLGN